MMNINAFIGKKIKELREKKQISQQKLAEDLGYESDTAIYLIEKGKRNLPIDKLQALAEYFGVQVEYIIDPKFCPDPTIEIAYRAKGLSDRDKEQVNTFIEFLKKQNASGESGKKKINPRQGK